MKYSTKVKFSFSLNTVEKQFLHEGNSLQSGISLSQISSMHTENRVGHSIGPQEDEINPGKDYMLQVTYQRKLLFFWLKTIT